MVNKGIRYMMCKDCARELARTREVWRRMEERRKAKAECKRYLRRIRRSGEKVEESTRSVSFRTKRKCIRCNQIKLW